MGFFSVETLALVLVVGIAVVVEIRSSRRHDAPLRENTTAIRKMADSAKPLKYYRKGS